MLGIAAKYDIKSIYFPTAIVNCCCGEIYTLNIIFSSNLNFIVFLCVYAFSPDCFVFFLISVCIHVFLNNVLH